MTKTDERRGLPTKTLAATLNKVAIFLMLGLFLLVLQPASTAYAEETTVSSTYTTLDIVVSWDYPYNDDYFTQPSDQYDHKFSQMSLGLALASIRNVDHPDAEDDYLISLFQQMGFSQIETEPYREEPTAYSVAYGFATKQIGDSTIVACVICGANYDQEWASNLTVGDLVRSKGFEDSSQIVEKALFDYASRNASQGNVKLWITGYSRGGAIANLAAADCIEAGIFADVYAYTFATPRTTREPVAYPNIFNIIQKEDFVPKIPLADWGFERYGQDMFLVSPEVDPDCGPIIEKAAELHRNMIGSEMVTNSEINYQLRILVDYLLLLFPDTASYSKSLEPLLVDIMTGGEDSKDALLVLMEALRQYNTDDAGTKEELKAMLDYLETLIGIYYLQGGLDKLPANQWNPEFGVATLFNGHFPFEYLAMMFASDNPEALFSDRTEYIRLMVFGNVDVTVSDGDVVLKEILADGTELVDGKPDPDSFPDVDWSDEKVVITLPSDKSYTVTVKSTSLLPQDVSYTGLSFSAHTVRAQADDYYSFLMNNGDTAVINTAIDGKAIDPQKSDYVNISPFTQVLYSPTTAMRMENNDVVHLTLSGFVNRLLLVIVILVVQAIVSLILGVIRKKKGAKRNPSVALIWHGVIMILFALLEVALWYFVPIVPLLKLIPEALVFLTLAIYAWKGCHNGRGNWKSFWIYIAVLAVLEIGQTVLIGDFNAPKGITLVIAYIVFLIAAYFMFWRSKEPASVPAHEAQAVSA